MSKWHDITDKDDVSISEDGNSLQICFDSDYDGNIWVEIPLELLPDELTEQIVAHANREIVENLEKKATGNRILGASKEWLNGVMWSIEIIKDK